MAGRELIIFDCDGVLVDSEPLVNAVEAEYFTEMGAAMTPAQARERFKGKTVDEVAQALEEQTGQKLSAAFGYDWGMTTALGMVQRLQPIPGVERAIERARAGGLAICVASQSPLPRVLLSLTITGLQKYFGEHVFTASMVERPKPAPDLFILAASRMGFSPRHCTVIEDSPSGVLAARAAGMRVFGYAADENAGALESAGATIVYSMDELNFDRGLVQDPS